MKSLLNEVFNIKNGMFRKKDGSEVPIAYIDPSTSESTYQYKDKIKDFGAVWIGSLKTWGWFTTNQDVYQTKIKPCLDYLVSVEKNDNGEARDVVSIIDKLLSEISSGNILTVETFNENNLKGKLEGFKRELINIMSDEELKEKLLPIIKFRNAQGHQYSLTNAILVYIQDPKATMVKSKGNWAKMNREVIPNSKPIALWCPKGGTPLTDEEKENKTNIFLRRLNKTSKKELTPGEKEQLRVLLKPKGHTGFSLQPYFYDIRFTTQIEGKEDLVGNNNVDLPWYDDSGDVTETTEMYCDAVISCAQDRGIKVAYVDELGGARGVSKSGAIDVLKESPKNAGLFNTLTHEYAHELLHQKYIKKHDEDPQGYGRFFIGTEQGRAAVEQQAELCAWIVLRNFGFDMPTNINYVGLWGMDENKAPKVFDTVADAATCIIKDITAKTTTMKESIDKMVNEMTGLDVAKMIGCEDIYLKNKEANDLDNQKRVAFQESFNKVLTNINSTRNRNLKQPFRL